MAGISQIRFHGCSLCVEGGFPIEEQHIKDAHIDLILRVYRPQSDDDFINIESEINSLMFDYNSLRIEMGKDYTVDRLRDELRQLDLETLQFLDREIGSKGY